MSYSKVIKENKTKTANTIEKPIEKKSTIKQLLVIIKSLCRSQLE